MVILCSGQFWHQINIASGGVISMEIFFDLCILNIFGGSSLAWRC